MEIVSLSNSILSFSKVFILCVFGHLNDSEAVFSIIVSKSRSLKIEKISPCLQNIFIINFFNVVEESPFFSKTSECTV